MIIDTTTSIWRQRYPTVFPYPEPNPPLSPTNPFQTFTPPVTRAEFDALKREMEDLKTMLKAAKKYDEATGQKDCEMADKVALIKRIAYLVGVDLSDLVLEGGERK